MYYYFFIDVCRKIPFHVKRYHIIIIIAYPMWEWWSPTRHVWWPEAIGFLQQPSQLGTRTNWHVQKMLKVPMKKCEFNIYCIYIYIIYILYIYIYIILYIHYILYIYSVYIMMLYCDILCISYSSVTDHRYPPKKNGKQIKDWTDYINYTSCRVPKSHEMRPPICLFAFWAYSPFNNDWHQCAGTTYHGVISV
jgi:hypothetical protein